jgi:hypothetical protein
MPSTITASIQAPQIKDYIRGDSRLLLVPVYEADGVTPFNLTGCTVFFTLNLVSAAPDDGTDVTAAIAKSVNSGWLESYSSPTVNLPNLNNVPYIAQIQLLNADTQPLLGSTTYYYDVQLADGSGDITSLGQNTFSTNADITTRV